MGTTDVRAICPECKKEVNARGLKGHRRLAHGVLSSTNPQQQEKDREREVLRMSEEETKRDICPTCHRPHVSVEDQVATVLAERDHKTAMEKATAIAEQARAENAQLKVQLTEAQKLREPETQDIPDFADVLEHCESGKCPVHAKALQDYREKVAGEVKINLAKPENKSHLLDVMKAAGVEEMPSKVVITGLGERSLRR